MNGFNFAAAMEGTIRQELELISKRSSSQLQPFWEMVSKFQAEFELLLDKAQYTNIDTHSYPVVDASILLGADNVWQEIVYNFGQAEKNNTDMAVLWMMQAATEKSGQFYIQAAANSAHPSTRIFFSSLAEAKNMLRRRFDKMLRILYNENWGNLGFAPFILGKD